MSYLIGVIFFAAGCVSFLVTAFGLLSACLWGFCTGQKWDSGNPAADLNDREVLLCWRIMKYPLTIVCIELGAYLSGIATVDWTIRLVVYILIGFVFYRLANRIGLLGTRLDQSQQFLS